LRWRPRWPLTTLGREPIFLGDLLAEVRDGWPGRAPDVGVVELAGGLRSPLAYDGDAIDLIIGLAPDLVILVADAGLGTLHAVRQSVQDLGDHPVVVVLNRYDESIELHRRNLGWLVERESLDPMVDVDALIGVVLDQLPTFCLGCGRPAADCPGGCSPPMDPPRLLPALRATPRRHHRADGRPGALSRPRPDRGLGVGTSKLASDYRTGADNVTQVREIRPSVYVLRPCLPCSPNATVTR